MASLEGEKKSQRVSRSLDGNSRVRCRVCILGGRYNVSMAIRDRRPQSDLGIPRMDSATTDPVTGCQILDHSPPREHGGRLSGTRDAEGIRELGRISRQKRRDEKPVCERETLARGELLRSLSCLPQDELEASVRDLATRGVAGDKDALLTFARLAAYALGAADDAVAPHTGVMP